jgi:TatD DNase family protein
VSRRRAPERLAGIADSHCHLQDRQFDPDREAVLERAAAAGIERILVPGWDVPSSEAALELAARHAPLLQAAVGVHPHDSAAADEAGEAAWERIEELAADPMCVAVGEIGLDLERNISPPDVQLNAFRRQLDLAARERKPVLVHCRGAHAAVTDALLAWSGRAGRRGRGALHAFSGDAAMATRLADAGFLISFALPIAFRSASAPREAARVLPPDAILLETDAPYLGPDRTRRNEPTTVLRVASEVARLRADAPESVATRARAAYEDLAAP